MTSVKSPTRGRIGADSVEKLKNEMTAKFRATPVEVDFRQYNVLQSAYDNRPFKIGLDTVPA